MTGRATFGDLATRPAGTWRRPSRPARTGSPARRRGCRDAQLQEFTRTLDSVLDRPGPLLRRHRRGVRRHAWPGPAVAAALGTRLRRGPGGTRELSRVPAARLRHSPARPPRRSRPGQSGPAGCRGRARAAGRDLLHTHFSTGPDGSRAGRSEWAPVVTSVPVTRALLARSAGGHGRSRRRAPVLALPTAPLQRGTRGAAAEAERRLPVAVDARLGRPGRPAPRPGIRR